MKQEEMRAEIQEIFRDVLGQSSLILHDKLTASDVRDWDSINHVVIVDAIERRFKIRFGLSEMDQLANVGDLFAAVEMKLKKAGVI
jgi:acyl carrier protein